MILTALLGADAAPTWLISLNLPTIVFVAVSGSQRDQTACDVFRALPQARYTLVSSRWAGKATICAVACFQCSHRHSLPFALIRKHHENNAVWTKLKRVKNIPPAVRIFLYSFPGTYIRTWYRCVFVFAWFSPC